jgi:hypothetical protein
MESIELATVISLLLLLLRPVHDMIPSFSFNLLLYIFFIYSFIMTHILITVHFLNPDQSLITFYFLVSGFSGQLYVSHKRIGG